MADDVDEDAAARAVGTELLQRAALDAPTGIAGYADRVLRAARHARRRRAGVVLAAAVVVLALGVPTLVGALVRDTAPTGPAATNSSPHTATPDPTVAIYAAAIRYILGAEPSAAAPRPVAIYDHTCAVAMNLEGPCPRTVIPGTVQAGITAALAGSVTVTWRPAPAPPGPGPATTPTVTLGPVTRHAQTVQVPITMQCGALCGRGLTAVLTADAAGAWTVTGTTGIEWIS